MFVWFCSVLFLPCVFVSQAEEELLGDLFLTYNKAARPVMNDGDTVNVTLGMTLSQIIDVQEKNQILVISAWIRQVWYNPILTWKTYKYNGIKTINVDPSKIWLPDIVLYNNADEDKSFGGNLDRLKTRAILDSDGKTTWLAPLILKSKCDIDVQYFPFDTQRCPLKFGSWTYDMKRLNLLNQSRSATLEKFSKNSEWHLETALARRKEDKYFCCPELYPDVTFTLVISRRSLFYLCNLIFPMTIIGMLTMLSFLLPAESGERVSLAITLLLAMTVFMLVVADIIPATSDVIPLVGIFFSASMIEMVVMIVVLCYIMRLHHKGPNDPEMSLWMRKYVLDWLAYVVRIRVKDPSTQTHANGPLNNEELLKSKASGVKWQNHKPVNYLMNHFEEKQMVNFKPTKQTEAELLIGKIDVLIERLHEMDREDKIKSDWRVVAMTIDRCLLIIFAILLLVTLVACFSMAPGYVP